MRSSRSSGGHRTRYLDEILSVRTNTTKGQQRVILVSQRNEGNKGYVGPCNFGPFFLGLPVRGERKKERKTVFCKGWIINRIGDRT